MRGADVQMDRLFSYLSSEAWVPWAPRCDRIRTIVDQALVVLALAFDQLYSDMGRPSILPEKLLRTLLLQAFDSVRSERQLIEQTDYNLLFRWLGGVAMDALVWNVTLFAKNRDRSWCTGADKDSFVHGAAHRGSSIPAISGRRGGESSQRFCALVLRFIRDMIDRAPIGLAETEHGAGSGGRDRVE